MKIMSDLRSKSVTGHDLTLEMVLLKLVRCGVRKTHRQIQRWATLGKIPGAYRLKRGCGHWRVRECNALDLWLLGLQCEPIAKKIDALACHSKPMLDRIMLTRKWSLRDFSRDDSLRRLNTKAIAQLPRKFVRQCQQNKDAMHVGLLARELTDKGVKPSQLTAAVYQAMRISRATFYRKGYGNYLALFRAA